MFGIVFAYLDYLLKILENGKTTQDLGKVGKVNAVTCEYIGRQLKKVTKITSINGVVEIVLLEYKSTLAGQVAKKNFECCS